MVVRNHYINPKPPRRRIRTWADDQGHLTHYDPSGRVLLICSACLKDPNPDAVLNQAITVANGEAVCEWHLFPDVPQPELDPEMERSFNGS